MLKNIGSPSAIQLSNLPCVEIMLALASSSCMGTTTLTMYSKPLSKCCCQCATVTSNPVSWESLYEMWSHTTTGIELLQWSPTSLVAQTVKRLSTMQETQVPSLGWEDPLEKEMAIHSSTAAWKIPWTEEPGRLQSMGSQRVGHDWATSLSL